MLLNNNNTKEAVEAKVKIVDFTYAIFKEMLYFVYSNTISDDFDFEENGFALWECADKYGIGGLSELCDRRLSKTITMENLRERFIWASHMEMSYLQSACTDFANTQSPAELLKQLVPGNDNQTPLGKRKRVDSDK